MPKPTDYDKTHLRNLAAIGTRIDRLFKKAAEEAARIGMTIKTPLPDDVIFSFDDYPETKKQIERLMQALKDSMETIIVNGVESAWTLSNNKNSALATRVFGDNANKLTKEQARRYFSTNGAALDAFLKRKENGLDLSDKVWRYTGMFKREIELGLDLGIRSGESAVSMAKSLRQYLQHPDKLFRRVRDKHGVLRLSKAAKDFHPGRGVYRSSYKNARRLAATETNIAYRTSDHLRWQQMDFVVGIEIKLSNNHTLNGVPFTDICDKLKGRYPKDFKFTGWHPLCRCHAVSILKTEKEMAEDTRRILAGEKPLQGSENEVRSLPSNFSDWIRDNRERAKGWTNMAYFVKDNIKYVDNFQVDTYAPEERKFTRAHRTKPAMMEMLESWLHGKYPQVPTTEMAAIYHYTRGDISDYRQLNKQLRENRLSEFNLAFSKLLSSALSKLKAYEGTTYRTIRLNRTNLKDWIKKALNQESVTFNGFTSTSKSFDIVKDKLDRITSHSKSNERDVILIIEGKNGRWIEEFSQFDGTHKPFPNQQEVLFDKDSRFQFQSVTENSDGILEFRLAEI